MFAVKARILFVLPEIELVYQQPGAAVDVINLHQHCKNVMQSQGRLMDKQVVCYHTTESFYPMH